MCGQLHHAVECIKQEYLRNFNREQLQVFTLEEYHDNPKRVLSTTFAHIHADDPTETQWGQILRRPQQKSINQQGARYKSMTMLPETRRLLEEFYAPCTRDLITVLNDTRFERWTKA